MINIVDDVPVAASDAGNVTEGALLSVIAAAGVLSNDKPGADGYAAGGAVVGIKTGSDTSTAASGSVGTTIETSKGFLTLYADGHYTYQAKPNAITSDTTDTFVYTIKDGDGDLATTTLTINLSNVTLTAATDRDATVYEKALDLNATGADLVPGTVTGSDPTNTGETDATNTLVGAVTGGTGTYTYALVGSATGTFGTIQVNSDGSYIYTLSSAPKTTPAINDGPTTLTPETFTYQATDGHGNTVTGSIVINIVDDVPNVTTGTAIAFNDAIPFSGLFNANFGADGASSTHGGIELTGFTGSVGSRAIINTVVTYSSASGSTVTYSVAFDYYAAPTGTATTHATGTLVFDKTLGTYTFDLAAPVSSYTTFSTSSPGATTNYDTQGSSSPEIVVQQYASNFYGVLTGSSGTSGSTSDLKAGGDFVFTPGETLSEKFVNYLNINTSTVGVGSDTLQGDELVNFDFYTTNPVTGSGSSAVIGPATQAYANAIAVTITQLNYGKEDIAILIKLHNTIGGADTTKLLIANAATDYVLNADGTYTVNVTTANYDSAHFAISGVQIVTSTENLTGTGYSLSTGAAVTLTAAGVDLANTSDSDVVKIIKIDVITSSTHSSDADFTFSGTVVDGDADPASFSFNAHIEANSSTLTGTSGADTLNSGAGNDVLTGGLGADVFKWSLGDQGTTATPASDKITDFTVAQGDSLDLRDLLQGEHSGGTSNLTQYLQFGVVSGKLVLSVDHDGGGSFSATQKIVLDNFSSKDALAAALGLNTGSDDAAILSKMIQNGNLKTDI